VHRLVRCLGDFKNSHVALSHFAQAVGIPAAFTLETAGAVGRMGAAAADAFVAQLHRVRSEQSADSTKQDRTRLMTSERQEAANRSNAQRSTGPRSADGKARSARNALKNGLYAKGLDAIRHGPLAEDEQELLDDADELIRSLYHRDPIEWRQALEVANCYLKLTRLDKIESFSLSSDSQGGESERNLDAQIRTLTMFANTAAVIHKAITTREKPNARPWHIGAAKFVIHAARDGKQAWVKGLWTKDRTPTGDEEWRKVVYALLVDTFGTLDDAAVWAWRYSIEVPDEIERLTVERSGAAAKHAIGWTLEKAVGLRGRLARQLEQALRIYQKLQERELPIRQASDVEDWSSSHSDAEVGISTGAAIPTETTDGPGTTDGQSLPQVSQNTGPAPTAGRTDRL